MTPGELSERLAGPNPPHLLDVRQAEEHAWAALPGSTLMPLDELQDRFEELAGWRDEEVVVYCHHGIRSTQAVGFLRNLGFRRLHNLAGGLDRWSLDVDKSVPRY